MTLRVEDFDGFELDSALSALQRFNRKAAQRGLGYFHEGRVRSLACEVPGQVYLARVRGGGGNYEATLAYDAAAGEWSSFCTCPLAEGCKHAYAALKQLIAEHSQTAVLQLSAGGHAGRPMTKTGAKTARKNEAAAVPHEPSGFAGVVQKKLGRALTSEEVGYLKSVNKLFQKATQTGLFYYHELTGLGLPQNHNYWNRLEIYPGPPKSEAEFWNYLALYLKEKAGQAIPGFLLPVTDLERARAGMRQVFRARDIARWSNTLAHIYNPDGQGQREFAVAPAELRLRLRSDRLAFEWRPAAGAGWTELKPRKIDEFEARYAGALSVEAALLWLPFWQRVRLQYASNFGYQEGWVREQVGRWLRLPLLRPLFADEAGEPLVFHEMPLHWHVAQPAEADGDYSICLMQADGRPAPELRLATAGQPTFYVTSGGVFAGPPFEDCIMSGQKETLIPAAAFESGGGLRLLDCLQIPPPPRLAARLQTIKLRPTIRAEIKTSGMGQNVEYCCLEVFGASEDGEHVEVWDGKMWTPGKFLSGRTKDDDFIKFDRRGLGALIPPLDQTGFKWDYDLRQWQLRISRKFAGAFAPFLQALPAETRIELRGELASFQNAAVAGKIRLEASEAEMDWFNLRVIVDVNDATLTKEEIKVLLDAKGSWVRLDKKGWRKLDFTLSEEEDQELARLGLTPHALTSEPQRLHAFQLADRAARNFLRPETCERIERRAAELQSRVTPDVPADIQAELRPYQRDGFHFLAYLSANGFGGILADDMGLGKTLQTLTWLAWLRNNADGGMTAKSAGDRGGANPRAGANGQTDGGAKPSLVVCPKSVADNWQAEAAKFFPGLRVRVWSASEMKSFAGKLFSADLHVLNYSQLRQGGEELAGASFHAVILDEGQYIKNPASQTAQVARRLRSEHRLILSGTPIENRLLDLWSLMSFAMPGALGSRTEFGRIYDAKEDPFARQRLAARVRPFLIRRTKAQVAGDLPDRVEEDLYCELEGEQKTLYRAELKRAQAMLLGVKTASALNQQRFNFLTSLLRLRQICCHARLVKPDSKAASAKVEALFETIEPIMEEGQKVLVFSQFVELLGLLREEAKARNWPHWYLAGDTEDRGALVKDFQAASGAGVFLISLKAGGFGLNLTAASYVVLFDPWWNPAVENQAIDRTHRIGQDRKVIAYRLLIKDSIEEKIRVLQRQKSSLAEDVLGEEKFSQSLSLEDLRYLLAG